MSRHRHENSEKSSKKFEKTIKPLPGNIFCQKGLRYTEKEKTKFSSRIPLVHDAENKIPKKIVKKFKNLKNLFPALFLAKTG